MRRPHVFQRSGPRAGRPRDWDPANEQVVARLIAGQLGTMIDKACGAGLTRLGALLDAARGEAETIVTG